jgi:ribosomal protein S6--L-glutamate ligase
MKAAVICLGSVSAQWIMAALKRHFREVDKVDIREIEIPLDYKNLEVIYKGKPLKKYDCVHTMGSYKYAALLRAATRAICKDSYMPIKASAFTTGHDKLLTHLKLQQFGIPQPTTYLASTIKAAKNILNKIPYPLVMKIPSGTQGKGVMFADSHSSASSMLDALESMRQPFILQEYVETGGVDIRAIVVGDKVVASMKRKAVKGEKRANIHAGGTGEACVLDEHTTKIAIDTAKAVGASVCGVDILEGPKGPVVVEVNLSPGLQGISKATKVNVAKHIADFLAKQTREFRQATKKKDATSVLQEIEQLDNNEIITGIDFRGSRILLPELVTKLTKFSESEEVVIKAQKGKLVIENFYPEE